MSGGFSSANKKQTKVPCMCGATSELHAVTWPWVVIRMDADYAWILTGHLLLISAQDMPIDGWKASHGLCGCGSS